MHFGVYTVTDKAILVFIALFLSSATLYSCERSERLAVEKELTVVKEVNKTNDEAIKTLKKYQESTNAALAAFIDSKEDIEKLRKSLTASIQKLLTTNEDFRKWFMSTVPVDAVRLYNETGRATSGDRE